MTLCFVGTFLIKLISFTPFHIFVKIPKLPKVHQQSHIFSLVRNKTTPEARKKKTRKTGQGKWCWIYYLVQFTIEKKNES